MDVDFRPAPGRAVTPRIRRAFPWAALAPIALAHAVFSAIAAVKRAIPCATLIETALDFVGLTDVADILGCTRQNMRKLMVNGGAATPAPVHEGRPSIWHLAHILTWLREQKHYQIQNDLLELAQNTMQLNIAVEDENSDWSLQEEIRSILA